MTKSAHHQQHHSNRDANSNSRDQSSVASTDASRQLDARQALLRESNYLLPDRSNHKPNTSHEINRKSFYIDQLNDRHFRGHTFACGPTSLTMALADHCAVNPHTGKFTVHHPPTEADRISIIKATGTWTAGEWIGGPTRMAAFAKHFGLNAQAFSSNNLDTLTRCLEQGKGAVVDGHCVRSGHAHYVYVAGKDSHGYIMGDPANPRVTHWSSGQLRAFMTGYGFTAVWNNDAPGRPRLVADAGGPGDLPAPAVPRQRSANVDGDGQTGHNRSLFRTALAVSHPSKENSGTRRAIPAVLSTAYEGSVAPATDAPPLPISPSIPRAFAPPPRGAYVGDSQQDQPPDGAVFDEFLPLQGSIDAIVNNLVSSGDGLTSLNIDDSSQPGCLSLGLRNWSQDGDLPELIKVWQAECPENFQRIFGDESNHLLDDAWVRDHNFQQDPELVNKLHQALADPEMQNTQIQLTRTFVNQAVNLAYQSGFRSDSSYAAVADACNRSGFGAVQQALQGPELRTAVSQYQEDHAVALMGARLTAGPTA